MAQEKNWDDHLITTRDLAKLLGISTRTVESYRANYPEKLPLHIEIGGRMIRYRFSTVMAWLAEREEEARKAADDRFGG